VNLTSLWSWADGSVAYNEFITGENKDWAMILARTTPSGCSMELCATQLPRSSATMRLSQLLITALSRPS
jgi:hypothetical protein